MWTQTSPFQSLLVWEVGKVKFSIWGAPTHMEDKAGWPASTGLQAASWVVAETCPVQPGVEALLPQKNPQELPVPTTKLTPEPLSKQPQCSWRRYGITSKSAYKFIPKPIMLYTPHSSTKWYHCHPMVHKETGISAHVWSEGSRAYTSGSGLT